MSFFGHMLAGTAQGLGQGIAQIGSAMEREQAARELQRERQAGALELARQREQDRADRERENLLLRKELGVGGRGAGGGKGGSLFEMAMSVPPEQQGRFVETVRAFGGDEAANVISRIYGQGGAATLDPARQSVDGYVDATGGMETAVPASVPNPAAGRSADVEKGRMGLQRLMALVSGPEHLKPYAEGERQLGLNDFGAAGAREALRSGASVQDAGETFNTVSNPRVNLAANDIAAQRLERMREAEEGKNTRHKQTLGERETRSNRDALLKERTMLLKTADSVLSDPADVQAARARIAQIDAQIQGAGAPAAAPGRAPSAARSAYDDWKAKTGQR